MGSQEESEKYEPKSFKNEKSPDSFFIIKKNLQVTVDKMSFVSVTKCHLNAILIPSLKHYILMLKIISCAP